MQVFMINGEDVPHDKIQAWEERRMAIVRRHLGLPASAAPLYRQRSELAEHKIRLGHAGLRKFLRRQLWMSKMMSMLAAAVSDGRRSFSVCEISVEKGRASEFVNWFEQRTILDDEAAMIVACPDHFIIARNAEGRQLVVETTGGSPLAGEFVIDYEDMSSLQTPVDQAYPYQLAGVARLRNGRAIGGVRHQFRDEGDGFRALLTVEFPASIPSKMVEQHGWHLAVEFSNWIDAAAGSTALSN